MKYFYALLLLLQPALSFSASSTCPQVSDYSCLVKNSIQVYREDPDQWFKIYNYTASKALKCTDIKDVTLFLRLWLGVTDGEMSEGLVGDSQEILTKNNQCFFEGLLGMSDNDRAKFIARFDVLSDDEQILINALKEAMNNPRYKSIARKMLNLAERRQKNG